MLIPSIGNNDGKWHYRAEDSSDKIDYYSAYFRDWFGGSTFNSRLPEIEEVKRTLLSGGYFRVDIDENLSVLSVNTLYLNSKNDNSTQGNEAQEILSWIG